jgi:carbonic anhydrase
MHSSAEHALAGALAQAEVHLVHVNAADSSEVLVLAVLLQSQPAGSVDNVVITPLFDKLAAATGGPPFAGDNSAACNPYSLLPPSPEYFIYSGSFTTPPCTEGVTWVVLSQLVGFAATQLQQFRSGVAKAPGSLVDAQGNNVRPLQPLNGRLAHYCMF